jgi:predicted TIM-barrel fold metal-dependent hydrolase
MNSITLDWLDLTAILSTFAACAVVGWFVACLMNRFQAIERTEPVTPIVEVQQIEVTVVDRGWRRWRRTARAAALKKHGASFDAQCLWD